MEFPLISLSFIFSILIPGYLIYSKLKPTITNIPHNSEIIRSLVIVFIGLTSYILLYGFLLVCFYFTNQVSSILDPYLAMIISLIAAGIFYFDLNRILKDLSKNIILKLKNKIIDVQDLFSDKSIILGALILSLICVVLYLVTIANYKLINLILGITTILLLFILTQMLLLIVKIITKKISETMFDILKYCLYYGIYFIILAFIVFFINAPLFQMLSTEGSISIIYHSYTYEVKNQQASFNLTVVNAGQNPILIYNVINGTYIQYPNQLGKKVNTLVEIGHKTPIIINSSSMYVTNLTLPCPNSNALLQTSEGNVPLYYACENNTFVASNTVLYSIASK